MESEFSPIGLSPVPVGTQMSPHAREFRASLRRIADMPDSLAERNGFELPVPRMEGPEFVPV
jgi:hypothetical protein